MSAHTHITAHMLVADGDALLDALLPDERAIFEALAADPTRVFTRAELATRLPHSGSRRVATLRVDAACVRLRRHLERAGTPGLVVNLWGQGAYRFWLEPPALRG